MILPAFGIISHSILCLTGKNEILIPIRIIFAILSIGFVGILV
jgi:heme/copper-type cytochrome/quinol oxidase subunit 1